MKATPRPSLAQACGQYVHRYTMQHVPQWATKPAPDGKYYAPHFRTDAEWYLHTLFPGEPGNVNCDDKSARKYCYTTGQTWPLGQWLDKPYTGRAPYPAVYADKSALTVERSAS